MESPDWTPDEIDYLTVHWDAGESGGSIAKNLKRSRSAILGKIHRLRQCGHVFTRGPDTKIARLANGGGKRTRQPTHPPRAPPRAPRINAALPPPTPVDLSHARPWIARAAGQCACPVGGEGADTLSCCAPSGEEIYCPAHRAILQVAPKESAGRLEKWGARFAA